MIPFKYAAEIVYFKADVFSFSDIKATYKYGYAYMQYIFLYNHKVHMCMIHSLLVSDNEKTYMPSLNSFFCTEISNS